MYRPRGGVIQVGLEIPGDVGLVCRRDVCTNTVKSQRADGSIVQSTITDPNIEPPPRSYCHAVSQGLFESPLGWSQHMYAHVMKAAFRKVNSNSAFVGRRDKPHSCSFHDTARFLFKKYIGYVNRHY